MLASERFTKIVALVNQRGFISTKELSESMNVTETTIRRDCEELESQGYLIRVHGGAKSINQKEILSPNDEQEMSKRSLYQKEKELVAAKAASFIKDGDCVFLDGGTSIVPMMKYLKNKKIKIVTHSALILNEYSHGDAELFLIGGKYIPEYNMSVGPITLSDLEKFNFDVAFLSCAGVDIDRKLVYTAEMDTMAIKQKAMELSNKNYLLIDSSKLSVKGFCSFLSSEDFDAVICEQTEAMIPEEYPINYIFVPLKDTETNKNEHL